LGLLDTDESVVEALLELVDLSSYGAVRAVDDALDGVDHTAQGVTSALEDALVIGEDNHLDLSLVVKSVENELALLVHLSFVLVSVVRLG